MCGRYWYETGVASDHTSLVCSSVPIYIPGVPSRRYCHQYHSIYQGSSMVQSLSRVVVAVVIIQEHWKDKFCL
jgi:hypothetical protein